MAPTSTPSWRTSPRATSARPCSEPGTPGGSHAAAGTIINPRLVRSQYYGGMIWGVSFASHEHVVMDPRSGRPMNPNLAEYHVPVNADVPSLEAILVEERDPHVNALGIKGVGEIGITGTAGAIANAVWHTTGVRVRDIPITLDKLLG